MKGSILAQSSNEETWSPWKPEKVGPVEIAGKIRNEPTNPAQKFLSSWHVAFRSVIVIECHYRLCHFRVFHTFIFDCQELSLSEDQLVEQLKALQPKSDRVISQSYDKFQFFWTPGLGVLREKTGKHKFLMILGRKKRKEHGYERST